LLNTVGYNADNGWQFAETRKAIRLHFAYRSQFWRSALMKAGLQEPMFRANGALVMDVLPFLSSDLSLPKQQDREPRVKWQRASLTYLPAISEILRAFAEQERIDELWKVHLPVYERGAELVRPILDRLERLSEGFEAGATGKLNVTVLPNLLDIRGRGYSVSTQSDTWLYAGGPLEDRTYANYLLIHELLHRWVDLLAEETSDRAGQQNVMPKAKARFRLVADAYPEFAVWLAEIVVRAAALWLSKSVPEPGFPDVASLLAFYEGIGLIGVRQAYAHLQNHVPEQAQSGLLEEAIGIVLDQLRGFEAEGDGT